MSRALDKDIHLEMYRKVSLIKLNDDRLQSEIRAGRLVMPYYSTRGQEIIPAAVSMHLTKEDYIVTIYRGIHDSVAKGVPLPDLWAELAGRVTGTCKGKGGPMHITHPESGVMVTTGIVGSSIPIGAGLAWRRSIRKMAGLPCQVLVMLPRILAHFTRVEPGVCLESPSGLPVSEQSLWEHTSYSKAPPADGCRQGSILQYARCQVDGNDPRRCTGSRRGDRSGSFRRRSYFDRSNDVSFLWSHPR